MCNKEDFTVKALEKLMQSTFSRSPLATTRGKALSNVEFLILFIQLKNGRTTITEARHALCTWRDKPTAHHYQEYFRWKLDYPDDRHAYLNSRYAHTATGKLRLLVAGEEEYCKLVDRTGFFEDIRCHHEGDN